MPRTRPFSPGDEAQLARICLLTADAGRDATGVLEDDDLWAELFVLPYVDRHPDLAVVVEADDGRVLGYAVAAADTAAFEDWFATRWWPRHHARWPLPRAARTRQDALVTYAYSRDAGTADTPDGYPAHLHIDVLPEAQGAGWGRALMADLCDALGSQGVPGVHASVLAENVGAHAFYERVGFTTVTSDDQLRTFGRRLTP